VKSDQNLNLYIPFDLSFFDEGEKTEKPTARKKKKSREEGQVAKSQEISTAIYLIFGFNVLALFAGGMLNNLLGMFNFGVASIPEIGDIFETVYVAKLIAFCFQRVILIVLPIFIVMMLVGIIVSLIQVGWHPTFKPLKPKFSKLNPLKGFKRLFSMQALVNLAKSLLKLGAILFTIFILVNGHINVIPALMFMELNQSVNYIGNLVITMGVTVGVVYIIIAALDYVFVYFKHQKQLKMTKHEVKEEWKQTEGNPQIKGKIKQKMREVSMRRMMQGVPKADVIITNPTHYAVALRYDHTAEGAAPVVIAKGVDFLAKRIKELGAANNVEIVENPALARALYDEVEVGREIPPELYEAVAEILAYVFRLKNRVREVEYRAQTA